MTDVMQSVEKVVDTGVDQLKKALKHFLDLLKQDLHLHMGKDVPHGIKMDVHIGAPKEHIDKVAAYHPRLQEVLNSVKDDIKVPVIRNAQQETKND